MLLGNNLNKSILQEYVRNNSLGLLYEPYKGEFKIKNPNTQFFYDKYYSIIDVKKLYLTVATEISYENQIWKTKFSDKNTINYHVIPEQTVYDIINNIILAIKKCLVESKKLDIIKDFI